MDPILATFLGTLFVFVTQLVSIVLGYLRSTKHDYKLARLGDQARVIEAEQKLTKAEVTTVHKVVNSHSDRMDARIHQLEVALLSQGKAIPLVPESEVKPS